MMPWSNNSRRNRYENRSPQVPVVVAETQRVPVPSTGRSNTSSRTSSNRPQQQSSFRKSKSSSSLSPDTPTSVKVLHNENEKSIKDRMNDYQRRLGRTSSQMVGEATDPEDAELVQQLATKSYHLPGNSWRQDWTQFMLNNHPVFGIVCHHPRHPIKTCTRMVALIGSLVVGLAITNFFYLFYLWNPQFNQEVFTVVGSEGTEWTLTTGMLLLWTLGSAIHATYNLLQWHVAACACCRAGGLCEQVACCPNLGKHLLRVLVCLIVALAILIVLLRVAISNTESEMDGEIDSSDIAEERDEDDAGLNFFETDDEFKLKVNNAEEFQFLVGWLVEMVLALFIYHPIGGTILFSGVLGCGKLPVLGGRPFEVAAEERRLRKRDLRMAPSGITTIVSGDDIEAVNVEHFASDREMNSDRSPGSMESDIQQSSNSRSQGRSWRR